MHLGEGVDIPLEYEPAVMHIATLLSQQYEDSTAQEQAIEAMQALLSGLPPDTPGLFRAALLCDLADTMGKLPTDHPMRKPDDIEAYYLEAISFYQTANLPVSLARIYTNMAELLMTENKRAQAKSYYEQALALYVAENLPLGQAYVLVRLGRVRFQLGDYEQAMSDVQQAALLFRSAQNEQWALRAEQALAEIRTQLEQSDTDIGH
jgi:tetratricopeptide (TPR) repeat protein